jgi:succinate dehydrogenase/fumarate reductase cytochrome b subunit
MTLTAIFRIFVSLVVVALLFWACNGLLYLFNHPRYPGEATAAVIGCLVLVLLLFWSAVRLFRWCRAGLA